MAREQFGICAEPSLHGYYLLFNVLDDNNDYVRQALSRLPALFDKYADRFSESNLTGVVAIGANYWDEIFPQARPKQLQPFNEVSSDDRIAPSVNYDLYIEVRSDRADVNHIVAGKVCALLADSVDLVEQVSNEDAIAMAHELMKNEGILVGISSGAAVVAAKRLAEKPENADKNIVVILPSATERYLSSPLFAEEFSDKELVQ